MDAEAAVSPLAPPGGMPDLPVIDGLTVAAAAAGIRKPGRLDVMLARLAPGSTVAGCFTRSATRAAPVLWSEAVLAAAAAGTVGAQGFAILVNAGNANAFTGRRGTEAVRATAEAAGAATGVGAGAVFTASTGVIGEPLPHERITAAMDALAADLAPDGLAAAARAIMTTDTFPKAAVARVDLGGVPVRIAGIAKGSGMIAPDMATMLGFVFTDAAIAQPLLQTMTGVATAQSFNCVTVDGDTSTSDLVLVGATGRAGNPPLRTADDPRSVAFASALTGVMQDLARQIARDGEGASKFVTVTVTGALDDADARRVAFAIANSPLVKTAIAGEDPNWGRIVMAVGKSGARADRDRLAIRLGPVAVAAEGAVLDSYRETDGAAYMRRAEIEIGVDLGLGAGRATVWTCDLTHRYIAINADYRS